MGLKWTQKVDPQDKAWVDITMRIPNGGMPTATYSNDEARSRIIRFCIGFLAGMDGGQQAPMASPHSLKELETFRARARTMPWSAFALGWMFSISGVGAAGRWSYVVTARLFPVRSTGTEEWRNLGACLHAIGVPDSDDTKHVIRDTDPNEPMVFRWTEDHAERVTS